MTTASAQIEQLLNRHDCTWTAEPALDLRRIDLIASITNQSRFEAIDQPTVDRYVAALEDGATFPPIVVRRIAAKGKGRDQLVILGGNHRVRAHVNHGAKTIDAYLVNCDDLVALEIAYADNATHGLPPTDAERIAHALVLIDRGRNVAEAARTVGVSHHKIRVRIHAHHNEQRAAKAGVAVEFAQLAESAQASLATLKDGRVFAKVVRTINTHQIGAGPAGVQRLIAGVNSQPDVAAQMDYIAKHVAQLYADQPSKAPLGRPSTNPYLQLVAALGTIRGLNPVDTIDRITSRRDRQELHERLLAGARHLMAIDRELMDDHPKLEVVS